MSREERLSERRSRLLLSLRFALLHLIVNARRLAVTIIAVAIGVALVVAVRLMNAAVLASFIETTDGLAGRAALTVSAGEGFTFPENLVEHLAAVPGVKLATPLVRGVAFPDDGTGDLLTVLGVDLANDAAVRVYYDGQRPDEVIDDFVEFLAQPDSVILGREWAEARHLGVGHQLRLVTPSGTRVFTVRGVLASEGLLKTLKGRLVVMDVFAAERAYTADGQVNEIDLLLADGADVAPVEAAVRAVLPPGVTVQEPRMRRDMIRSTVRGFQAMLMAFALLAVVAGFVICHSRLRMLFEVRSWEVGLLRAVGLRRSVVFVELLKESALLGAAGVSLGVPLGLLLGRRVLPFVAAATALNFRLPVPDAAAAFDWGAVWTGVSVGLLAAVLAAVLPALRLARTHPIAALRSRGMLGPPPRRRLWAVVRVMLLIVTVGSIAVQWVSSSPALGAVTTLLVIVMAATLAAPLVVHGARVVGALLDRVAGPIGAFAASEISRQAGRASPAVAALGVGLGAVLLFGILGRSFERSVAAQLAARFQAPLVVHSAFMSGGWVPASVRDDIVSEIVGLPGVALASGQHISEVPYRDGSVSIFSYDPPCFRDPHVCRWPLAAGASPDALERVAAGEAVLIAGSIAREYGIGPGDAIVLGSPSGSQEFRVVAIAGEEPARAVIMSRARYAGAWKDHMVTWIHVVVDRAAAVPTVAAQIEQRMGERYRLQVHRLDDFIGELVGQARRAFRSLYVMDAVALVLVLIAIADSLAAGVMARSRELGALRAIGLRRSRVLGLVLAEGSIIGLLGIILAIAAGVTLSCLWVYIQFPLLLGWNLGYSSPTTFVVVALAVTFALCLLGALGPSLRAAHLAVTEVLREE